MLFNWFLLLLHIFSTEQQKRTQTHEKKAEQSSKECEQSSEWAFRLVEQIIGTHSAGELCALCVHDVGKKNNPKKKKKLDYFWMNFQNRKTARCRNSIVCSCRSFFLFYFICVFFSSFSMMLFVRSLVAGLFFSEFDVKRNGREFIIIKLICTDSHADFVSLPFSNGNRVWRMRTHGILFGSVHFSDIHQRFLFCLLCRRQDWFSFLCK